MKLTITHQESYSRGELLLRSFFGIIYMILPHFFLMIFCALWDMIGGIISFWTILFTGKYPRSFFDYRLNMMRWSVRLNARTSHMVDGYPSFFPSGTDDKTSLDIEYPESLSRGTLLLKAFFGLLYCQLPHGIVLMFRSLWGSILSLIAWWIVLFTGTYPKSTHDFNRGTMLWSLRVSAYMGNMTDKYPPFSGADEA
jgi:hypothetical protein